MNCKNCGKEIKESVTFCPECGKNISYDISTPADVNNNETDNETIETTDVIEDVQQLQSSQSEKSKSKKTIIAYCGTAILILIAITSLLSSLFSPKTKVSSYIEDGEFDKAKTVYAECKENDKEEVKAKINELCRETFNDYNKGKIVYEDAKDKITKAEEIISSNDYSDKISELHSSKEAFSKAEEYVKNEKWENAKAEYSKVISDDINYKKAIEAIPRCEKEISIEAFNRGQEYETEGKWAEALTEYEKVTEASTEEYKNVSDRKTKCIEQFKTSVNVQLDEMFTAEQYEEGLELIKLAEKYITDDAVLQSHKENFTAKKEEADRIKEENKYNTGITYNQLARNPDDYKGEYVKFYGKVLQVQSGSGMTVYRIGTSGSYYSDSVVYAIQAGGNTSNRVLEDDYVTVKGQSSGLYTYTTVMGNELTIPSIIVDSIDR